MDERMIFCLPGFFSGRAGFSEEKPEKLHLNNIRWSFEWISG